MLAVMQSAVERKQLYLWTACKHGRHICTTSVAADARAPIEAQWNELAEKLLAEYTERWTPEERASYRHRLKFDNPSGL